MIWELIGIPKEKAQYTEWQGIKECSIFLTFQGSLL